MFTERGFYTKSLETVPEKIRFAQVKKWPFKVGFWYAISDCGVSEAYVWSQGLAIDGQRYKTHCLQRRLIPFLVNNGILDQCVFWPDKASSHYSTLVLNYLRGEQLSVIPKQDNPTNFPQCRPIENFHEIIKRAIFADGFEPETPQELMDRTIEIWVKVKNYWDLFILDFLYVFVSSLIKHVDLDFMLHTADIINLVLIIFGNIFLKKLNLCCFKHN